MLCKRYHNEIGRDETPCTKRVCRKKNFLDLPRELRDLIYESSLVSTVTIDVCRLATSPSNIKKLGISTALLRVSKQIHREGVEVMYGLNTFEANILLDPRVAHSFHLHQLEPQNLGKGLNFTNPMIRNIKRLIIRLEFNNISHWPSQDPSFPSDVLQAFILGGHLDLIVLKPRCISSYVDSPHFFDARLAMANAALVIARGSLFAAHLLSCVAVSSGKTHVVYTPQPHGSFQFLDFPWTHLDPQPADNAVEVLCHVPSRFGSTGQMKLAGSTG